MIEFTTIRFKNILSYGNTFTELSLNSHKTTLITATNGSGKSTILDCIVFALYNKPYRKINKSQLVNTINKNNLVVELEFITSNKNYKIVRGIKPNIFEIYENSILLNQDAKSKDYQEFLENNILNITFKSFIQVVILGSARFSSFMDLTAADRRGIIEDLLDIQIFSTMNTITKERQAILKSDIYTSKTKLDNIKDKLDTQKRYIQERHNYSEDKIIHFNEEISKYNSEISSIQDNNIIILDNISKLTEDINDKSKLETRYYKLLGIGGKLASNITRLNKEQVFFNTNDSCPTCRQLIDLDHKQGITMLNNDKIYSISGGISKLDSEVNNIKIRLADIDSISSTITSMSNNIMRNNETIKNNLSYIKNIESEISSIKEDDNKIDKNKIKELLAEYSDHDEKYKEYTIDKLHYDYISVLLKDGGVKTQIIKQYLPLLNKYINKYLDQMDFFVNFNIDESFDEVIKSRHRDAFSYSCFSEGEKLRINLALLLAFKQLAKVKNSVNVNIQFFDEIADGSADSQGVDSFMTLISEDTSNVFVISHRTDDIIDKFDRVLKINKVKNFSRIEDIQV